MASKLTAASNRLEDIPVMQGRVDAAVSSIYNAGAENAAVDDQVSRLRDALRKRDSEVREFESVRVEGSSFVREVSRLGKAIGASRHEDRQSPFTHAKKVRGRRVTPQGRRARHYRHGGT